jgi:MOSC domain-containing protein
MVLVDRSSGTFLPMPTLARINVTPVKGTALHHIGTARLTDVGIEGNRRFHLADERGRLYSGVAHGPLVQVVADLDDGDLICRFPDGAVVRGPADRLGGAVVTDFYDRAVAGTTLEGPFAEAFSDYVGEPVRLVRTDRDGDGPDVFPLTVISLASVAELGRRGNYDGELDPLRFRINLELGDTSPFEEDTWDGRPVRVGEAVIRIEGQIPRCVVTTQDPLTGVHDWNTLKQIAAFRPLMAGRQAPFGVYATVVTTGAAAVGDDVEPLKG